MRVVISNPTLVLFRDAAGRTKGGIDRLAVNAKSGADHLADMGVMSAHAEFQKLKRLIKDGAKHDVVSSQANTLFKKCQAELFSMGRLDVIPGTASLEQVKQSSESLAWIMAYAVYGRYEYMTVKKIDTIIALLDRQYHKDIFDSIGDFEEKILEFIPMMQAMSLHRESIIQRLIAYSQTGDDLTLYQTRQSLEEVKSAFFLLETEYEKLESEYDQDMDFMRKAWDKTWDKSKFQLNTSALESEVTAAYRNMEDRLARNKVSAWTKLKRHFDKPDSIQALSASLTSVKSEVQKSIQESKDVIRDYALKAKEGHTKRLEVIEAALQSMVTYSNLYRNRPAAVYSLLEASIRQHQDFLREISIEAKANEILKITADFATDGKFEENIGPKLEGMTAEELQTFMDDLGGTVNKRSEYKQLIKKVKNAATVLLAALTVGVGAAVAQQYLFHTVTWYFIPLELSILVGVIACAATCALINHWDVRKCLSFHTKLDAIEPVSSDVVGRPSFERPIVHDRYVSPKELELQAQEGEAAMVRSG